MRKQNKLTRLLPAAMLVLCGMVLLDLAESTANRAPSLEPPRPQPVEVTVSAAISMKDALDTIAALYRRNHSGAVIHFNLGGSGTLEHQIEQGAPVDVFISASPKEMNTLESKGLLLDGTRNDLAKNRVVLIVPADKSGISGFQDLAGPDVKFLAVGEPQTVPAGKYAQEILTHMGLYDRVKAKLVMANDVRQVLEYVETGNADAGIVYTTDAGISSRVKVVATAPEDTHSPVIYPVAVIKDSKDTTSAKDFENFLLGPEGQQVFKKYGFASASR